jgi:hypothetical protein
MWANFTISIYSAAAIEWRTFPRFTLYTARVSNPVLESPEKGAVMKSLKQTVVVTIFAALACTALHAQSVSLQATIPFDFRAGDKLMPAGEYAIQEQGAVIFLRAADGKSNLAMFTHGVESRHPSRAARLDFNQYGNEYFLTTIWDSYTQDGREVPPTSRQRELAKQGNVPVLAVVAMVRSK